MINLQKLNSDEMVYLCHAIPSARISGYFTQYPKDFNRIKPGFRAKALKPQDLAKVLLDNQNAPFIANFIQAETKLLIMDIESFYEKQVNSGYSSFEAYIVTLAGSRFDKNIALFFKITQNTDFSEEALRILEAAVGLYQSAKTEQVGSAEPNKASEREIKKLKQQVKSKDTENAKLIQQVLSLQRINGDLNSAIQRLSSVEEQLLRASEELTLLRGKNAALERDIKQAAQDKKKMQDSYNTIMGELGELKALIAESERKRQEPRYALRPSDVEEFKECLEYNFDSIGLDNTCTYRTILVDYVSRILFRGEPIITNQIVAHTLASCVSNALYGVRIPEILVYTPQITSADILKFLETAPRVVCLDGFLGNYNELELLPLIAGFRDKILFLTCISERTVHYLSDSILLNCTYFNANRVSAFLRSSVSDDDPSEIEEVISQETDALRDNRYRRIFREIAEQCNIPCSLICKWEANISSDDDLCQVLGFTLLPFCYDVCYMKPFQLSARLQKYAGNNGSCQHREIFTRWFGR